MHRKSSYQYICFTLLCFILFAEQINLFINFLTTSATFRLITFIFPMLVVINIFLLLYVNLGINLGLQIAEARYWLHSTLQIAHINSADTFLSYQFYFW